MTIPPVLATILSIHFICFRPRLNGEFGITTEKYGNVTYHLFRTSERARLEVPLKGFGGGFQLPEQNSGILPLIAGRIVIRPPVSSYRY
jgi:NAD(P)H-flavin reductase